MKHFLVFLNGCLSAELTQDLFSFISLSHETFSSYDAVFIGDGGLKFFDQYSFVFQKLFFVGDKDSSSSLKKEWSFLMFKYFYSFISLSLPTNKDESDFHEILEKISSLNGGEPHMIHIIGGLQGRKDHEWVNLLEVVSYCRKNSGACVVFERQIVVSSSKVFLSLEQGTGVSFLSLKYPHSLFLSGTTWEGNFILKKASHGLSNIVLKEQQEVASLEQEPLMMFLY